METNNTQTNTSQSGNIFTQPIDKGALTLSRAIALKESGKGGMTPDYNAVGDAGTSKGAGQWQPGNFESDAKRYGLDPNDFSPENQDKVLYAEVLEGKKNGLTPEQIAAAHNAGMGKALDGSWQKNVGTTTINGQRIHYDTPGYVKGVQDYYQKLSGASQGFNPQPYSHPTDGSAPIPTTSTPDASQTPQDGLGSELNKRAMDASNAISQAASGKINPLSGILQTGGAIGGAIGDVTNAGLKLIPGVSQAEDLLGKGVSAAAQTAPGQAIVEGINSFAQAHPELSADIGAVGNIATAIPILKGVGIAKDIAGGAIGKLIGSASEKASAKELGTVIGKTIGGRKALAADPESLSVLASKDFKPEVTNGVYNRQASDEAFNSAIGKIDDEELTPMLQKASTQQISTRIPLDQYRKDAVQEALDNFENPEVINSKFDMIKAKYGDYPTLEQMNEAKRTFYRKISESQFGSPDYNANKTVSSSLQKSVEDGASAAGLGDVHAVNQKMGKLIKARKLLKYLDQKSEYVSPLKKFGKSVLHTAAKGVAEGLGVGGVYEGYKQLTGQ